MENTLKLETVYCSPEVFHAVIAALDPFARDHESDYGQAGYETEFDRLTR